MEFSKNLSRERKARGLSQEELAARLGVSRQAVSKWETGEAAPDLSKLLALADALDLPLDTLCGRETSGGPSAAPAAAEPSVPPAPGVSSRLRLWQGLCGVLALLLLAGGVWIWYQRSTLVPSEDAPAESTLPDTFSAAGESFSWDSARERLDFRFIPGIADESCSYQITFTGTDNVPHTFDAPYSGGVCTGSAELTPWDVYDVTVSVSDRQPGGAAGPEPDGGPGQCGPMDAGGRMMKGGDARIPAFFCFPGRPLPVTPNRTGPARSRRGRWRWCRTRSPVRPPETSWLPYR